MLTRTKVSRRQAGRKEGAPSRPLALPFAPSARSGRSRTWSQVGKRTEASTIKQV